MEQLFYDLGDWLRSVGAWAYVLAPLVMAAVAILPIPAEAPAMVNGALFGPIAGTAVTWIGAMLGAIASFELARRLGRPAAERLVRRETLERADDVVTRAGWWGMLLARFMPFIAFTVLNWGAGLTPVGRWRFVWTTAVGILPGTILFTASGWGLAAAFERLPWVALGLALAIVIWMLTRHRHGIRIAAPGRRDPGARSEPEDGPVDG